MAHKSTRGARPPRYAKLMDAHKALEVLVELVQWLDFFTWFVLECPEKPNVNYGWFVRKTRKGSCDWQRGVRASDTERVIRFIQLSGASKPISWVHRVMFGGGTVKEVDTEEFIACVRGEIRALCRAVFRLMKGLTGWFPREEVSPSGKTVAALHADYLDIRGKVIDYYRQIAASRSGIILPVGSFPEPVPLPQKAAVGEGVDSGAEEAPTTTAVAERGEAGGKETEGGKGHKPPKYVTWKELAVIAEDTLGHSVGRSWVVRGCLKPAGIKPLTDPRTSVTEEYQYPRTEAIRAVLAKVAKMK